MIRYVALLRNIGPATHARMPLRALTEKIGQGAVNIGNTGNIVLATDTDAEGVKRMVAQAAERFGVDAEVFVRTHRQIQMLVNLSPFPEAQLKWPSALGVCFFHRTPNWPAIYRAYSGSERLQFFSNHLIVDYRGQITGSRLRIESATGARMTQRNWSSVLRIAAKLADA